MRESLGIPVLRPLQRVGFGGYGPPLLVGGTGDRVLKIAADIIGIAGAFQVKGQPPGTLRLGTAAEADERVRFARELAGGSGAVARPDTASRNHRSQGRRSREPAGTARADDDCRRAPGDALRVQETPFAFIGSVEQIADQVLRNRGRYGFTYYTVHASHMDAFAPVIEQVRAIRC
ncbi:hypothetical protein ACWDKQ_34530 [Saccharopolyspora sp. NPDC000995]